MNETQQLVNAITEGIQDKKGKNIVVADLTNIGDTICQYFIICQGKFALTGAGDSGIHRGIRTA